MSAPTLAQVVAGLADRLRLVDGLRVYDHIPGGTEYPAALVVPPEIDYRQALRMGAPRLDLEVVLLVSGVEERFQKELFDYLSWTGPRSVLEALEGDPSLGLTGVDCHAMRSRPLGEDEMAGYRSFGAAVQCTIVVTNPEQ